MAFISTASGYKGQGYDITSGFDRQKSDNPVGSEDALSAEIGARLSFWGGRVRLNPTLFWTTYKDYQAQQALLVGNTFEFSVANVGELVTSGAELDFEVLLLEDLRLVGGVAFTQAEIEEWLNANCYDNQTMADGCVPLLDADGMQVMKDGETRMVQDLSGKDLNNSPELKATLSAEYTLRLDSLPFDAVFNASYQYQDDIHFDVLADPGTSQDAYGQVNLSAGILHQEGRYGLTFFVNNLLNEEFVTNIANVGNAWTGDQPVYVHTYPREAERYIGVNFGLSL